jgi:plastocyanin
MNSKRLRIVGIVLIILALGSVLLAACARPGTPEANAGNTPTSTSGGGGSGGCASGSVHMSASNFVTSCVNVTKGSKLTLIDDVQVLHLISNGMWDSSGNQVTTKESGAPTITNVSISGGQKDVGPFTTAGTYHIYCSVHLNMNLVVNVK